MDMLDFLDLPADPVVKPAAAQLDPICDRCDNIAVTNGLCSACIERGKTRPNSAHYVPPEDDADDDAVEALECRSCGTFDPTLDVNGACYICRADGAADDQAVGVGDSLDELEGFGCAYCGAMTSNLISSACPGCRGDVAAFELSEHFDALAALDERRAALLVEGAAALQAMHDANVIVSKPVEPKRVSYGPIVPPDAAPPEQPVAREEKAIDRIGLPTAAVKVLMRNGFETIADLRERRHEIASLRGIGAKTVEAIGAALDVDAVPGVDAAAPDGDATVIVRVVALPVVVTVGKLAMLVEPGDMRVVDLDDILDGVPNAVEVLAAFLNSAPFADGKVTRLHVRAAAAYVDQVIEWARSTGVAVFGSLS